MYGCLDLTDGGVLGAFICSLIEGPVGRKVMPPELDRDDEDLTNKGGKWLVDLGRSKSFKEIV